MQIILKIHIRELCLQVRPTHNIQSQKEVLRYQALPGVETVHSTLVVRATQDLFKNNKIKLRCVATIFSMYRRSQEIELQENPTQLALIMVPETQSKQGIYLREKQYVCWLLWLFIVNVFFFDTKSIHDNK